MKSQIPNPKSQIISKSQSFKQFWNFDHWILKFVWKLKIKNCKLSGQSGQLLVEAILAIALIGVLAGIIGMAVMSSTQSNKASGKKTVAASLAQEAIEAVRAIRDNNETTGRGWNRVYLPPDGTGDKDTSKGDSNPYYIGQSGGEWVLTTNTADRDIVKDGVTYERSVVIKNVCRDIPNGGGDIIGVDIAGSCSPNYSDPSTQYVKVTVTASGISAIIVEEYLTRAKNEAKVWDTDAADDPNTGVGFKSAGASCSNTKVLNGPGVGADVELSSAGGGC